MKSIFRAIIVVLLSAPAAQAKIVLISHDNDSKNALYVKKELSKSYSLPINIIQVVNEKYPCKLADNRRVIHICLNDQSRIIKLVFKNEIIERSFKSFQPKGEKDVGQK